MVFEFVVNVPTGDVSLPKLIESTNALLMQLKANPNYQEKQAKVNLGNYTNLNWKNKAPFQSRDDITTWGVKTLPGGGGFYFANHEDDTLTLAHIDESPTPTDTYRELEYIKSTGTQYIITDFALDFTDKVVLDTKFGYEIRPTPTTIRKHRNPFGYWGTSRSTGYYTVFVDDDNDSSSGSDYDLLTFYVGFPWTEGMANTHRIYNADVTTRKLMTVGRPTSSWGETTCLTNHEITVSPPTTGCPIFACECMSFNPVVSPFSRRDMYLYSFKVYDSNNALTHDLIPVEREGDGAVGLYDRVENKFYGNLGTGEFVKGSVVENMLTMAVPSNTAAFIPAVIPIPQSEDSRNRLTAMKSSLGT